MKNKLPVKFRIVKNNDEYRIQLKKWYWPFWVFYRENIFGFYTRSGDPKIYYKYEFASNKVEELEEGLMRNLERKKHEKGPWRVVK